MSIDIIGVQLDAGAARTGVCMGPMAIRLAGLVDGIERMGKSVNDKGDILQIPNGESRPNMKNFGQVMDANKKLFDEVTDSLINKKFPIILGGDHSIAAGSVSAVAKYFGKIGLIWIDAHGDWNDDKTTETGNMHGMPCSAVCGFGPDVMIDFGQNPVMVNPKNCVLVGVRNVDPAEGERMKKAGITVFSISDIDKIGIETVMKKAIEIASNGTVGIHLSYDVDSIAPEAAPGTGTPVSRGLNVREAYIVAESMADSGKMLSMDMVEVNPILDNRNKTGIFATELILSCLGKKAY